MAKKQFVYLLRLLVAISCSRLLTIIVCSTALFEITAKERNNLDNSPIWARLFTQAVGRDVDPAWAGPLGEFVGEYADEYASPQYACIRA